jgi:2-polyprenyl-3-methyl-5-hydroxy-6-metoxy-1,4-benzoquinol methylase
MSINDELVQIYQKNPGYYSGARQEMLPFYPAGAKTVLDVGCGEGNFGALLKKGANCTVWGTDIDAKSIEVASTKLDKTMAGNISDQLDLIPNNYFDAIFFNDVLEHLIDPYSLLKNISSKLSDKGVVIASIPNIRHFRYMMRLVIDREWQYEESGVLDKTHLRFFTKKSMVRMFEENGYEVISVTPINKTKSMRPIFVHLLTLGLLGREISYLQFVVIAKKKS